MLVAVFRHKLVFVDQSFTNPFKSDLCKDTVHKFVKEGKYCSGVMKKHFNKALIMTKADYVNFECSRKC